MQLSTIGLEHGADRLTVKFKSSIDNNTIELVRVVRRPLPRGLFEIPRGYREIVEPEDAAPRRRGSASSNAPSITSTNRWVVVIFALHTARG